MKKPKICLDARMIHASGIGRYIRSLLPFLGDLDLTLIGDQEKLQGYNVISCIAPIFSLKEQLELPMKIPECDLFWSPHYNVPLGPIRAKKRLVTVHDLFPLSEHSIFHWYEKIVAHQLLRKAFTSEGIITVSNFSKHEIESRYQIELGGEIECD